MTAWALLRRVRLRALLRSSSKSPRVQRLQVAGAAFLGLLLFVGVLGFSLTLFRGLRLLNLEAVGPAIVALVFTSSAFALLFLGMGAAVHALYLSRDLPLLLSMPIPVRTVLSYKFAEILLSDLAVFGVLSLPVVLGYGIATGMGSLFYLLVLPVSVLVLAIPAGLSVLLVMPVMRVLPAGRAREIVAAFSGVVGVGFWALFQLITRSAGGADSVRAVGESPAVRLPPGAWAADAVLGAGAGEWGRTIGGLLPLGCSAALVWVACLVVAERAYLKGWARTAEGGRKVRGRGWAPRLLRGLPPGVRAVAAKDLTTFPRDLRQLTALGALPFMGVVIAAVNRSEAGGGSVFAQLGPYLFAGGASATATIQLGLPCVGGEGRGYWLLAAAPLSARQVLAGKWVATWAIGAATVVVATAAVALLGFDALGLALGMGGGVAASGVFALYAVGVSAAFPRFDWENPKQATARVGAWLMGGVLAGLFVWAGLMAALAAALHALASLPLWIAVLAASLVFTVGTVLPGWALYMLGQSRLERLQWEL